MKPADLLRLDERLKGNIDRCISFLVFQTTLADTHRVAVTPGPGADQQHVIERQHCCITHPCQ